MKPIISIIIPVYNTEKYLLRCINSLKAQSIKSIEMIFVDDGSSDNSLMILQKAAMEDYRISVLQQSNLGPSAARNRGIVVAKGDYIMFCDSDDTVKPEWCQEMLGCIHKYPNSWVVSGVDFCDEQGKVYASYGSQEKLIMNKDKYWQVFYRGLSGQVWNKIYRRDIILSHRVLFNEELKRGEDVIFNLDYLVFVDDIFVTNQNLYNYYHYISVKTLTNVYYKDEFAFQTMLFTKRKPFISENDLMHFEKHYWNLLNIILEDTLLNKNELWIKRIQSNQKSIENSVYHDLVHRYGKEEMHVLAYLFLEMKWYIGYWIIQRLSAWKHKIGKRR